MNRSLVTFAVGMAAVLIGSVWISETAAQSPNEKDYLSPALRQRVEALKADFARQPTSGANIEARGEVMWEWINAYSLTGAPAPAQALMTITNIARMLDGGTRGADGSLASAGKLSTELDDLIREYQLKDEKPNALGAVTINSKGPFAARSYQTIELTYTVGEMPIEPGGSVMVARAFQMRSDVPITPQFDDPAADNYVAMRCSNPRARFAKTKIPWTGIHGGFRGFLQNMVYRLEEGTLRQGDTITIVIGDRSGGSRGWLMPNFQNDDMILPIYIDLDGKGLYLTPKWAPFEVVGKEAAGVRGVAPSVLRTGEPFELVIRSEDEFRNRATGPIPAYEVSLNGKPFRTIPAGSEAIVRWPDLRLERAGVYRFGIRSRDGAITGASNPVWVQDDPAYRIYWGETHGHTGMAEGMGTVDTFYRYGRDDALLDFAGLSEHDIVLDDWEWRAMQNAVRQYTRPGKFIAFLGYEWTMNRDVGGHHNVFFRSADSARVPAPKFPRLALLYQGLRETFDTDDVLIIPHAHNAGDWRMNDPEMERVVEIQSMHGTFEWFGNYYLRRGFQVGFLAGSDDHRSRPGYSGTKESASMGQVGGLAAVLAPEKTTEAIFDALRARSVYATTAAERIIVDVALNGGRMGTRQPYSDKRRLDCRVMGTAPIDELAVIKNGDVVFVKRPLAVPLRARSTVEIRFESTSEPFIRDNPRPYRRWKGTLAVRNARLTGLKTPHLDNRFLEYARIDPRDPNRVVFYTETRGRADILLLELANATPSTAIDIKLEETEEYGASPALVRDFQTIPATEVSLPFSELRDGILIRATPVGRHIDTVTLQVVDPGGPMDDSFTYVDNGEMRHGDYYYVRVKQLNGSWAWSSPIWIGGEPRK